MTNIEDMPKVNYLGRETTKEDVKRSLETMERLRKKIKNWDGAAEIRKWRDQRKST
jgi:hypothetical protein